MEPATVSQMIELFTDGACKGNPGKGGWGVLLRYNGHEKRLYGGEAHTTNNRMELMAVIKGLGALKRDESGHRDSRHHRTSNTRQDLRL